MDLMLLQNSQLSFEQFKFIIVISTISHDLNVYGVYILKPQTIKLLIIKY